MLSCLNPGMSLAMVSVNSAGGFPVAERQDYFVRVAASNIVLLSRRGGEVGPCERSTEPTNRRAERGAQTADSSYYPHSLKSASQSITSSTSSSESIRESFRRSTNRHRQSELSGRCPAKRVNKRRIVSRTDDDSGCRARIVLRSTWTDHSSVPHWGQVASPTVHDTSTQTVERQTGQLLGKPSGVLEEIVISLPNSFWCESGP